MEVGGQKSEGEKTITWLMGLVSFSQSCDQVTGRQFPRRKTFSASLFKDFSGVCSTGGGKRGREGGREVNNKDKTGS